jgi:tetratricopeptide (TPR) repeat protein
MKIFYLKFVFVGFLLGFFAVPVLSQRSNGIAVEGKITVQQGLVEGAFIQMFIDGRRMDNYGIGADGRYKVELNYNHKFELVFTAKGNFSQKFVVDATVPKEILQTDPRFPPFPLDINLFTEIPGIDKSFTNNTILKIYYNNNVDNFVSELYYNDAQIARLIEQAKLQGQQIGKESDYLSKLTRAEQAEMRKEYNTLLAQADKQYSGEQFLAALDGYKAAGKIFPNEQFPKDRIAEINDLLGLMMVAAELDKALAERFDLLIKEADQLMMQKNYTDARNSYNRALSIKPNDSYANQQVNLINDLLQKQLADEQYTIVIAQADNSFKQLLYNEASKSYQEALEIKPNESYPKTKLQEINEILASEAKNAEKMESYKQAMQQGEIMFQKQFYEKSLASYENALSLKPGDEPATRKIEEVKGIMNRLADKLMYDKLIASGDKAYKKDLLKEALPDYVAAATIIPDDKYANQRIEEINQKLQLAGNFADLIAKADNEFNTKNYSEAKSLYQEALKIRANDKYSLDRVREIDVLLAAQGVEEKYNTAINQADELLKVNEYENAKGKYNEAAGIKPKEKYPKDKILEINNILSQIAKTNQTYQQAVAKADGLFNQKSYEKAKEAYADAGRIKPEETYPPEMIGKIDNLIAEQNQLAAEAEAEKIRLEKKKAEAEAARLATIQAEKDKNYSEAIAKADNLFNEKQYESARNEYRIAQTVKPEETYPQQRITEIGTLMAQLSAAQKTYEDAVAKGDREFKAEKFDAAKLAYNDAQKAKPEETYPGEQIAKIDSTVETRARLAAEAEAERVRLAQEAAAAEAARLAAIQAEKDKNYNEAITKADNLFNEKQYENARNEYRTAQTVKPEETYPQQRITEIGNLMAQLSAAQKTYEDAVAKGDREFKAEKFDAAKLAYNDAQKAKPEESYPGEQIAKIDSTVETRARLVAEAEAERIRLGKEKTEAEAARLAAIQAEKDKNYSEAIAKADNLFNEKQYENARNEYRTAQTVKPEETYPQQRITEIGNLMAQLSAAQKTYEDAVAKGDREFKAEKFDVAKLAYNDAQKAKPEETYPTEMIAKIDSTVETRARLAAEAEAERIRLAEEAAAAEAARLAAIQAEKDKNYSDAIAKADNLFNEKQYESARNEYRTAQTVKPEETYPQQRITEIGNLMAQLSAAQKTYEDAVAKGDREFKAEKFDAAKLAYNDAQKAKPEENYPTEMIAKIDSTVETRARLAAEAEAEKIRLEKEKAEAEAARLAAIQAEKDKNYNEAITKADNLFNEKQYESARNEYRTAQTVKPEETYPQQRITEIGTLMAQLSAAQKAYEDAVTKGDREFKAEKFDVAKLAYADAQNAKPEESYPGEMIAKIDSTVETRARLAAEAEAERVRLAQEVAAAEAARLAAIQAEKDKNYSEAIAKADNLFNEKQYESARNEYRTAQTVKPEETYPQQRITEIGNLMAQLSAAQKAYEDAVAKGDREFKAEKFDVAKLAYADAQKAKPEESYPGEQIAKIDSTVETRARLAAEAEAERIRLAEEAAAAEAARLAAIQAEKDKNYNEAIAKADNLFNEKQYESARNEYRTAQTVKPEETYPKQRLDEIGKTLATLEQAKKEQELADRNYANAIQQADRFFAGKTYDQSKAKYNEALTMKPEESYPKDRIAEIDRILEQQVIDEKYRVIIVAADGFFKTESYLQAKTEYEKALTIKAGEQYPKNQIAKIDDILQKEQQRILAEKKTVEDLQRRSEEIAKLNREIEARGVASDAELKSIYDQYIRQADESFGTKLYVVSRGWYYKAWDVKPDENYPKQRIDEINRLLKGLLNSQLDRDYQRFVDMADSTFRDNQYAVARGWYNRALGVKANEQYPKDQIKEIENKIAERMAGQSGQQFETDIQKGETALQAKNYNVARFWYKKALELRPDNADVKNKLKEIDEAIRK